MERLWHHRANDDSINSVTNQSELKTTTCIWCKAREKQVGVTITRTERDQCTGMTRSGTGLSRNDSIMTQTSVSLWCHSMFIQVPSRSPDSESLHCIPFWCRNYMVLRKKLFCDWTHQQRKRSIMPRLAVH